MTEVSSSHLELEFIMDEAVIKRYTCHQNDSVVMPLFMYFLKQPQSQRFSNCYFIFIAACRDVLK